MSVVIHDDISYYSVEHIKQTVEENIVKINEIDDDVEKRKCSIFVRNSEIIIYINNIEFFIYNIVKFYKQKYENILIIVKQNIVKIYNNRSIMENIEKALAKIMRSYDNIILYLGTIKSNIIELNLEFLRICNFDVDYSLYIDIENFTSRMKHLTVHIKTHVNNITNNINIANTNIKDFQYWNAITIDL